MSGQLHAPVALPPGKEPPVPTGWEARRRKKIFSCQDEGSGKKTFRMHSKSDPQSSSRSR